MKIKNVLCGFAAAALMSSCVLQHTAVVTNNSVGSKVGVAQIKPFSKELDLSYSKAKENGKITKVGIAEFKVTQFILPKSTLTVTGE